MRHLAPDPRSAGPVRRGSYRSTVRARCSWTERMAAEPSPTAAATRLVEPDRRSPTANRPGQLVSYEQRPTGQARPGVAELAVVQGPVGQHEPVLVEGDAVQPLAVGLGADEREQRRAVDLDVVVDGLAGDRDLLQRRLAGQRGDRGALVDLDAGVVAGCGRRGSWTSSRPAAGARRRTPTSPSRPGTSPPARPSCRRRRPRSVTPAHMPGLQLGGRVVHAGHLVVLESLDGQLAVVGARSPP